MNRSFFSGDNAVSAALANIFNVIELNLLWLLCSLPVVTVGASTTALYSVMLKIIRKEEGRISTQFFAAFRENLKQTIPAALLMLAADTLIVFELHILRNGAGGVSGLSYGFAVVLLIAVSAVFGYVWPLFAQFENTVRGTFNNAWRLAATQLPVTLVIVAMNAAPFVWLLVSAETFSAVFWVWLFCGIGVTAYVCSALLVKVFDRLIEEEKQGTRRGGKDFS